MIENQKDVAATKLARKEKRIHAPSWISIAGHVYLEDADDKRRVRIAVMLEAKFICALCQKYCSACDGDVDHVRSGRPVVRCWCFGQTLADGTACTNLRWVHGMFSVHPCHRNRHNREIKWTAENLSK